MFSPVKARKRYTVRPYEKFYIPLTAFLFVEEKKSYPYLRAALRCGAILTAVLGIPMTALAFHGSRDVRSTLELLVFLYFMSAVFLGAMGLARGTRPTSVDYAKTLPITMMSEKGTGRELRGALDKLYMAETDLYACSVMSGLLFFIAALILIVVLWLW